MNSRRAMQKKKILIGNSNKDLTYWVHLEFYAKNRESFAVLRTHLQTIYSERTLWRQTISLHLDDTPRLLCKTKRLV